MVLVGVLLCDKSLRKVPCVWLFLFQAMYGQGVVRGFDGVVNGFKRSGQGGEQKWGTRNGMQ